MDHMAMAVALIKAYRSQYNRGVRAQRRLDLVLGKGAYMKDMRDHGLEPFYQGPKITKRIYNEIRKSFQYYNSIPVRAFTSKRAKSDEIRRLSKELSQVGPNGWHEERITHHVNELDRVRALPVYARLGKLWQTYLYAHYEMQQADKEKYEVRCAIKVFNKLDTGIAIRFGNMRTTAMNRIYAVRIDGFDIPVSKFLDNVEFENAVLAAS
jgi:hypothetical protein